VKNSASSISSLFPDKIIPYYWYPKYLNIGIHIFLFLLKCKDEEITTLRNDFERQAKEIESKYERKMRMLRDELELRRKTEIHEVEERKNSQINTLMKNHEKAFSDIKNYYNDITLNNLALINSLKVFIPRNTLS